MKPRSRTQNLLNALLIAGATTFGVASYAATEATQTARFGVFVAPMVRWIGPSRNAATLTLDYDAANSAANEVSETFRLVTNVDVRITANVTNFTNTENPADTLTTLWKITDDKDGDAAKTGVLLKDMDATQGFDEYVASENFLKDGIYVTHQSGDGNVKFIVTARGEKQQEAALEPQGTQRYEAHIILTAIPTVAGQTRHFSAR